MRHANVIAIFIIIVLALSVFGAINVTAVSPVKAARIGTKIDLYVPPLYYGGGLIPDPYQKSVRQGGTAIVAIVVTAADKKFPCSPPVTCRVDGRVMGTFTQTPLGALRSDKSGWIKTHFWPNNCRGGGAGAPKTEFTLSGKDTARLSVGVHHFTVSYPGNTVYAPSTRAVDFVVTKAPAKVSTSTPSSTAGPFVGSKSSDVYHYPKCADALKINPANLVTFRTVADAKAAGYRPCLKCHPPS